MKDIIIEFSGWVTISAEKVKFVNLLDESGELYITGEQWLALGTKEQTNYILDSVIDCQKDAEDGEYDTINYYENKER